MSDIYDIYKPFRNYLKQFSLIDSLAVIRSYVQFLQFGQPLTKDVETYPSFLSDHKTYLHEWEIEVLTKEIILNSDNNFNPKTLKKWQNFSKAINTLKDLENAICVKYDDILGKNILLEIFRISHRQFPWQAKPDISWITRYYKIFSHKDIEPIIQKHISLTTKELYTIGIALTGIYLEYFASFYPPEIEIAEINRDKLDKFLNHFSTDFDNLKKEISSSQLYNQDYAYAFNPLIAKPLIRTIHEGRDSIICPIPTFLFKRFTEGVYFEICNDPNFANPFGQSFQNYIGEILEVSNINKKYKILGEEEYYVEKNRKNSVDWIITDDEANLFIECKTKKLRAYAKIALIDNKVLNEDLDLMSTFIVQIYKTINDYQNNHYKSIKNNKKSIFPLLVTLEDWYIFGNELIERLDDMVINKLKKEKLDQAMLTDMPYSICATNDFEKVIQIINSIGIKTFMDKKVTGEKRLYHFHPVMINDFNEEYSKTKSLFPNDYRSINPAFKKD